MTFNSWSFDVLCEGLARDLAERSYAVIDDFFDSMEVDAVLSVWKKHLAEGDFKQAGIGAAHQFHVNKDVRKDKILWIDPKNADLPTQGPITKIQDLMRYINRFCFLGLKDIELHYAYYPKGAYYKRHLDQFKANDHRRLTFICYLNRDWSTDDGGILRMYLKDPDGNEKPFDISPLGGRLVCFRSDEIEHEVLICHKDRFSLTGWMLDQLKELTFL